MNGGLTLETGPSGDTGHILRGRHHTSPMRCNRCSRNGKRSAPEGNIWRPTEREQTLWEPLVRCNIGEQSRAYCGGQGSE